MKYINHDYDFENESVSIRNLVRDCESGAYNLNPDHQRNVIHSAGWKRDIIDSLINVGDIPGVYFHPTNRIKTKFDSLDGKQRCSAIVECANDALKYDGKFFSKHDEEFRAKLLNTKVSVKSATRTLDDNEIEKFFLSRQYASNTKLGEKLNSQITTKTRQYLLGILGCEEKANSPLHCNLVHVKRSNNRFEHLEIMSRLMYCQINHGEGKIDLDGEKKFITWFNNEKCHSDTGVFKANIYILFQLLVSLNIPYSGSKTVYLPIFAAILKDSQHADNIRDYYSKGNKFNFKAVGGSHTSAFDRYIDIITTLSKHNK